MQFGLGFWASKTLLSAVELGLFTELAASGPLDGEALRQRLGCTRAVPGISSMPWWRWACWSVADGRYANTPATDLYLDRNKPSYVGGMLEMANARLYRFWGGADRGAAHGPAAERGQARR